MKKEKIVEVEKMLRRMKLPMHRKTIKGGDSVRWLHRNLCVENANNPLYPQVIQMLGDAL